MIAYGTLWAIPPKITPGLCLANASPANIPVFFFLAFTVFQSVMHGCGVTDVTNTDMAFCHFLLIESSLNLLEIEYSIKQIHPSTHSANLTN